MPAALRRSTVSALSASSAFFANAESPADLAPWPVVDVRASALCSLRCVVAAPAASLKLAALRPARPRSGGWAVAGRLRTGLLAAEMGGAARRALLEAASAPLSILASTSPLPLLTLILRFVVP